MDLFLIHVAVSIYYVPTQIYIFTDNWYEWKKYKVGNNFRNTSTRKLFKAMLFLIVR